MDFIEHPLPGTPLDSGQLEREVERALRNQRPLTLIAARVVGSGPEECQRLSELLVEHTRSYDSCGRVSCGTVLVLLPEVDLKYGITVAERMAWRTRRGAPDLSERLRLYVTTLEQTHNPSAESFLRAARDGCEVARRTVEHNRDGLVQWRQRRA